jgi:hypothetical protein
LIQITASATINFPGSRGIIIVILQIKFIFDILELPTITEFRDKTLQTGSKGLLNGRIPLKHLAWLPHVTSYLSLYSTYHYL